VRHSSFPRRAPTRARREKQPRRCSEAWLLASAGRAAPPSSLRYRAAAKTAAAPRRRHQ